MNKFIFKNEKSYLNAYELLSQNNIFSILKIEDDELKHTNIIEWLLKYNKYQGLKIILNYYFNISIDETKDFDAILYNDKPFYSIFNDILTNTGDYLKRPDILVDIKYDNTQYYLLIENKIFAYENDYGNKKQTEIYEDIMEKIVIHKNINKDNVKYIYLNVYGKKATNNKYISIDYNELYEKVLKQIELNEQDKIIFEEYVKSLKRPSISKDFDINTIFLIDKDEVKEYLQFYNDYKESIIEYLESMNNIYDNNYDLDYITIKYIICVLLISEKINDKNSIILKLLNLSKSRTTYYWTYNGTKYSNIKIIECLIIDMLKDKIDILEIFKDIRVGNDIFITDDLTNEERKETWIKYLNNHPGETIEDYYFTIGEKYYVRKLISYEVMLNIKDKIDTNKLNNHYKIELYEKSTNSFN